tara:strand:+ start:2042 stop:2341 length:300 start_codon:yes stop_codon:yes gene_type:complete
MLLIPTLLFASTGQDLDFNDPSALVTAISPLIILAATWAVKKLVPIVSGVGTLIVVTVLSAISAWVTGLIIEDGSWLILFLAGLGSVFINQVYVQFTEK